MEIKEAHNKFRKRGTIGDALSMGITEREIDNIIESNRSQIRETSKEILKEHIKDSMMLDIMVEDANLQKLARKGRFEHQLVGWNNKGEKVIELKNFIKTTQEIKDDVTEALKEKRGYLKDSLISKGWQSENIRMLSDQGYIKKLKCKIIFRKG